MTETFFMVAQGSVAIFTAIAMMIAWATMSRWILQVFEKLINVMDVGHFKDRSYD